MCNIIVEQNNTKLDYEQYYNTLDQNPHGLGVISFKNKVMKLRKYVPYSGTFHKEEREALAHMLTEDEFDTRYVHTRFATHGLIDDLNTHPFRVRTKKDKKKIYGYVMHNGVFSEFDGGDKNVNDTRKFISYIASQMVKKQIGPLDAIRQYGLGGNKICYINLDGTCNLFGDFRKVNDNVYSSNPSSLEKYSYSNWHNVYDDYIDASLAKKYSSTSFNSTKDDQGIVCYKVEITDSFSVESTSKMFFSKYDAVDYIDQEIGMVQSFDCSDSPEIRIKIKVIK